MSEWVEGFRDALLRYIRLNGAEDARTVLYWDEDIDTYAANTGCSTCGFGGDEVYTLNVHYERADGTRGVWSSNTTFGDLISSLVDD
jgi:hypothetical protein